jgi:hypothetical protein
MLNKLANGHSFIGVFQCGWSAIVGFFGVVRVVLPLIVEISTFSIGRFF